MAYRTRIYYSAAQKAEMWDRWQQGETLHSIARLFDRHHTSVRGILAATGGIRPPERRRSHHALTLAEREEISRGIARDLSLRAIAARLKRAPSTISREVNRNGGLKSATGPARPIRRPGIEPSVPSPVNWSPTVHWPALWRRNSDGSGRPSKSLVG